MTFCAFVLKQSYLLHCILCGVQRCFLHGVLSPPRRGTYVPACVSCRGTIVDVRGKPVRWRSTLRPFRTDPDPPFGKFLLFLISASDSSNGRQTEPGSGLSGGPGPVPWPGPGREGTSLGVARRAPTIGKKMGEAGVQSGEPASLKDLKWF